MKISFDIKRKLIIWVLYLAYLWYLFILFTNWELASGGKIYMGIIQGIIPLSAAIFIHLVLIKEIKIAVPM